MPPCDCDECERKSVVSSVANDCSGLSLFACCLVYLCLGIPMTSLPLSLISSVIGR